MSYILQANQSKIVGKALKSLAEISGGIAVLIWTGGLIYAQSWTWTRPVHPDPAAGLVYPFSIKQGGVSLSAGPHWFISATDVFCWHLTFIVPALLIVLILVCGWAARSLEANAEEKSN